MTLTPRLQAVFDQIRQLPDEEQDHWAERILEFLAARERSIAPDPYLLSLCQDYITAVDGHRSGSGDPAGHDSARLVLHEQLLEYTGLTRETDMYRWCCDQLAS